VLHAMAAAVCAIGRGLRAAVIAVGRFWADVFRAILPDRGRDDDDDDEPEIEVVETDVLEAGEDERAPEPKRPANYLAGKSCFRPGPRVHGGWNGGLRGRPRGDPGA